MRVRWGKHAGLSILSLSITLSLTSVVLLVCLLLPEIHTLLSGGVWARCSNQAEKSFIARSRVQWVREKYSLAYAKPKPKPKPKPKLKSYIYQKRGINAPSNIPISRFVPGITKNRILRAPNPAGISYPTCGLAPPPPRGRGYPK